LAFVLPVGQLIAWTLAEIDGHIPGTWELVYGQYILTTVGLAAGAAIITVILSLVLAQGARMAQGRASRVVVKLATLGYAMPGAVVAAGVLLSLSAIDRILGLGLILTGSLVGLLYAYVVRFMAVSYNSVESSLVKVKPSMEQAARIMGAGPLKILRRVHAPLVTQGLAAGAILVFVDVMKELPFVDVMKELPATMLLRPFGMDTLGIWSYMLASEAFYQAAALPALTILAAGLIPVLILMRVGGER